MTKIIQLLSPNRIKNQQMTRQEYQQHIEHSQYHMPAYLALSRHISIINL
ncbi:MAG: hypothetical protein OCD03_00425 [Hyphomicrobiales bacterium]